MQHSWWIRPELFICTCLTDSPARWGLNFSPNISFMPFFVCTTRFNTMNVLETYKLAYDAFRLHQRNKEKNTLKHSNKKTFLWGSLCFVPQILWMPHVHFSSSCSVFWTQKISHRFKMLTVKQQQKCINKQGCHFRTDILKSMFVCHTGRNTPLEKKKSVSIFFTNVSKIKVGML